MIDTMAFVAGELRWIGYNGRERLSVIVGDEGDRVLTVDAQLTEDAYKPVYKTFSKAKITSNKKAAELSDELTLELVGYAKNGTL